MLDFILRLLEQLFGSRAATPPVPVDTFSKAFDFIMSPNLDGRQNDTAPGETTRTSWGVTQTTWDDAVQHGLVTGLLQNATKDQCRIIFKAKYWNALKCDELPPPAAFVMFCDSVLTGTGHVAKLAQRIVGTAEDGIIGEKSASAISKMDPELFVNDFIVADEEYLETVRNSQMYINGWRRREVATQQAALSLTAKS